jgi:phage terminase large subunit-like protein
MRVLPHSRGDGVESIYPDGFEDFPDEVKQYFINQIEQQFLIHQAPRWEAADDWKTGKISPGEQVARNKQLPPDHPKHHEPWVHPITGITYQCESRHGPDGTCPDWDVWIFMAGRGTGKTLAGAQWTISMARKEPKVWVGVCAPTFADIKNVCFEGTSGILNVATPGEITDYNKNGLRLTLRNGSIIQGYSAEKPDSIRGANLYGAWFDELAMIRYMKFYDYGLEPALRVGSGRLMVTTTPRRMKLIRMLVAESRKNPLKVHLTEATSDENPNVGRMVAKLRAKYAGTVLERQELGGELLDEVDGALFTVDMFADNRLFEGEEPEFRRIVVSVDPATTSSDTSDESGVMVVGEGVDRHFYTLEDCSLKGSPEQVMSAAVQAYRRWDADCVVGEVNGVGDYMKAALYHVDPYVPFRSVRGLKGKYARAEPVSILAQQGRIHMVGTSFDKVEEQLCSFSSDDDRTSMHDDRADAWVWGMLELSGLSSQINYREMYGFTSCDDCGEQVHERESKCGHCGAEIQKIETLPSPRGEKRWAAAYLNTCDVCGTMYNMRVKKCPQCEPAPQEYLQQAGKLSGGQQQGRLGYAARDWMRGRRI